MKRIVATFEGGGSPCYQVLSYDCSLSSLTLHIHAALGGDGPRRNLLTLIYAHGSVENPDWFKTILL
jgi:hypothetical protein